MHEIEEKVKSLCEMQKKLVEWSKAELDQGKECVDTEEMGEVVDMIKDLAEAEKACCEAHYYKTIVKAMKDAEEEEEDMVKMALREGVADRMGYNTNRSATTGRYTSGRGRGRSSRMGFSPVMRNMPYIDEYIGGERGDWDWDHKGRMGYPNDGMTDPRHGEAYNKFQMARRHYTETKSDHDREEMQHHAHNHVEDTIHTIRDIWADADPELKRQMKADFTKLIGEMTV